MTVHDRVKLVVKWLIGTGVAKNQESIGRLLGYSNKSSFSQILNNKVPLPNDFIDRLCILNRNINKVWIEEEIGNMIADISTPISPINENIFVPSTVSNQSDTIALRLMDKLDEKDNIISEKEAKIEKLLNNTQKQIISPKLLPQNHLATMEKTPYPRSSPPPQRDHRLGKHNHFVIKAHCFMKTEDEVIEVNYTILLLYINLKQQNMETREIIYSYVNLITSGSSYNCDSPLAQEVKKTIKENKDLSDVDL